MVPRTPLAPLLPLIFALGAACGDDEARSTGFGSQTGVTSASTTTAGTSGGGSSGEGSTGDETAGSTGDPTNASGATLTTTSTSTTGDPNGLPNGSECTEDSECKTGNCFTIPIPINDFPMGICADCDEDVDCTDAGTGISCTLNPQVFNAVCTDGGPASYCQSQAACKPGLFCDELVDGAMGLLPNTCGECRDDADCAMGTRCVATVDVATYAGTKKCAAPGSVANDDLCPLTNGDAMCASGHCGVLDLAGLLMVGVCGACGSDADCGGGTCTAPKFDSGFLGSFCM